LAGSGYVKQVCDDSIDTVYRRAYVCNVLLNKQVNVTRGNAEYTSVNYIQLVADFSNQFITYCSQFLVLLRLQQHTKKQVLQIFSP